MPNVLMPIYLLLGLLQSEFLSAKPNQSFLLSSCDWFLQQCTNPASNIMGHAVPLIAAIEFNLKTILGLFLVVSCAYFLLFHLPEHPSPPNSRE